MVRSMPARPPSRPHPALESFRERFAEGLPVLCHHKLGPLPSDVCEWLAAGHEIGAHTVTHCRLTRVPPGQAREEILASRHAMEDRFGVPVGHFCYPCGKWSPRIRGFVEEAGHETAVTLEPSANAPAAEALTLSRFSANRPACTVRNFLSLGRAGFPLRFFWQK